jgi:hypothetical protein
MVYTAETSCLRGIRTIHVAFVIPVSDTDLVSVFCWNCRCLYDQTVCDTGSSAQLNGFLEEASTFIEGCTYTCARDHVVFSTTVRVKFAVGSTAVRSGGLGVRVQ